MATTTQSKPAPHNGWASTATEIAALGTMDVTLFSGAKLTLRTVDLDELALEEALPLDLFHASVLDQADLLLPQILEHLKAEKQDEALQLARASADLRDRVCRRAIVDPKPTEKLLAALDSFDKRLIVEIAQRKRSTDATGKVIAAQSLGDFDGFRAEPDGDPGGGEGGGGRELDAAVV